MTTISSLFAEVFILSCLIALCISPSGASATGSRGHNLIPINHLSHAQSSPSCVFNNSIDQFYDYSTVMDCFALVPFNQSNVNQTLDILERAMQLYAFLDIATDPPNQQHFGPGVDLLKKMESFRVKSYDMDYEFQLDLRSIFRQLHDAHTNYYAPTCYSSFSFFQPINLMSYVKGGNQVIAVSRFFDDTVTAYYAEQGIDVTDYVGAEVLTIDSTNALKYLYLFGNSSVGSAKDPATRFNIAMTIPGPYFDLYYRDGGGWLGLFSQRFSHFIDPPSSPQVTYEVRFTNGTEANVTFPWLAQTTDNYSSTQNFTDSCINTLVNTEVNAELLMEASKKKSRENKADPSGIRKATSRRRIKAHAVPNARAEAFKPIPIAHSVPGGSGVYQIDNRTMVWYMNTFDPTNYYKFEQMAADVSLYAKLNGLDRLVLDLTLNGGGDICLGRSMLSWLFPNFTNYGPTDMPSSPLAINMTLAAVKLNNNETMWSAASFQSENNNVQYQNNNASWMIPGIPRVRAGLQRNYSELIHISEKDGDCGDYMPFRNLDPFQPDEIIIMTHGFCGSTCALFADHLHNYENVKTVVVGGISGQAQQYTSFPGLQIYEDPNLIGDLYSLKFPINNTWENCDYPTLMPTTSGYRLCIREIYGPDNYTIPLEYAFQEADIHLDLTEDTVNYPYLLWQDMLGFFSS
eukprot:TRINITY_DN770_c0_g3_i2.p1 TRINITY_DN770_c0_g3~~TRINITY_DN770_c0_g3_i2.p1  ORF type:complete len:687 (-),score=160.02 TRINITY_DN770_c0_g3_i2:94-2154(-)